MEARGIRDNNPGNIRHGIEWQGMADEQLDSEFVTFTTPVYGIRAIAKIIHHYQHAGILTLSAIISRWAPPTENNTAAYISAVSSQSGVDPEAEIRVDQLAGVIQAIIVHENGHCPYDMATIQQGILLAGEA